MNKMNCCDGGKSGRVEGPTVSPFHFLTVQLSGETINLVVEIPQDKLKTISHLEPKPKWRRQCAFALEIARAMLAQVRDTGVVTQIYNREITRANFDADYVSQMILSDGSKGWIVEPRRLDRKFVPQEARLPACHSLRRISPSD